MRPIAQMVVCWSHDYNVVCRFKSHHWPGSEVIELFPCSTQSSTKFILLINVKMPTIVGILTFMSTINTTFERLKSRNFFIYRYFIFCEEIPCSVQLSTKKVFKSRGQILFPLAKHFILMLNPVTEILLT